jgi:hypothetical protein
LLSFCFIRDAHSRMDRYWFLGGLRKASAYIFGYTTSAKHIMWNVLGDLEIATDAVQTEPEEMTPKKKPIGWWDFILGRGSSAEANQTHQQSVKVERVWAEESDFKGIELAVRSPNCRALNSGERTEKRLELRLGPEVMSFEEFVESGWRRENEANKKQDKEEEEEGWTSKLVPALRFRPSDYYDDR